MKKSGAAHNPVQGDPNPTDSTGARRFDARRVYTAAILIPAVYVIIRYLPPWMFTLLVISGGALALLELYRISFGERLNAYTAGLGLATLGLIIGRAHLPIALADVLMIATMLLVSGMLLAPSSSQYRFTDTCILLFGVLYVGLALSTLVLTRLFHAGEFFILFVAIVTWAGDTGAYYSGNLWGRRLLAPRISPKKTVEGLIGGLGVACAAALVVQAWLLPHLRLRLTDALILGVLLTGAGVLGDLCESAIKRSVGAKDSGGILPGHGGMLDRLDSLLFTAPTFYYYVLFVRGLPPLP